MVSCPLFMRFAQQASHGWFFWNWRDGAGVAWDRNADCWGEEWMLKPLEQIDSIDGSGSHDPFKVSYMGLSENVGYIPNYSHLIGIMIINHWV